MNFGFVKNVIKTFLNVDDAINVMQNIFNKVLKIGLVEMKILTNLFKLNYRQNII
jgi:glycerol-3-phosphate dehydrogenase